MKRSTFTRSAHRLAVAAVAGAVVLAPVASVADDAAAGSETDLAPAQGPSTTTETPDAEQPPAGESTEPPAVEEGDPGTTPEEVEPTTPEETPDGTEAETPVEEETAPEETAETPTDEATTAEAGDDGETVEDEEITPDLGLGKFSQPVRVGSSLLESTYVPEGVTTAGTVLRITESNPDFDEDEVTECTTDAATAEGTATYCVFPDQEPPLPDLPDLPDFPDLPRLADGGVSPLSIVFPENADEEQDEQVYLAERGSTVTVETVSLPAGLIADPDAAVVEPCPVTDSFPVPTDEFCTRQVALVEATGLPPVAVDDTAETQEDEPVTIDVLENDDPVAGAPIVDADLAALPENGEVRRVGSGADTRFTYTPAAGFSGTDSFGYGFVTPNGVAFAEVTVTVEPAPVEEPVVPINNPIAQLPDAGGPGQELLGLAGALLVAGAAATVVGRRRDSNRV